MKSRSKWLVILAIMGASFLYAHFQKSRHKAIFEGSVKEYVLEELPEFSVQHIDKDVLVDRRFVIDGEYALVVHFWGTWCAPCEEEFPDLMNYLQKLRLRKVRFLIVAVNDDLMKVNRFLARFDHLELEKVIFAFTFSAIALSISFLMSSLKMTGTVIIVVTNNNITTNRPINTFFIFQ